jgi:hypothetical protein
MSKNKFSFFKPRRIRKNNKIIAALIFILVFVALVTGGIVALKPFEDEDRIAQAASNIDLTTRLGVVDYSYFQANNYVNPYFVSSTDWVLNQNFSYKEKKRMLDTLLDPIPPNLRQQRIYYISGSVQVNGASPILFSNLDITLDTGQLYMPKNDPNIKLHISDIPTMATYDWNNYNCRAEIIIPGVANPDQITVLGSDGINRLARCYIDSNNKLKFESNSLYRNYANGSVLANINPGEVVRFQLGTYLPSNTSGVNNVVLSATAINNTDPDLTNNTVNLQSMIYNSDMEVQVVRETTTVTNGSDQVFEVIIKNNGPTEHLAPSELTTSLQSRLSFKEFQIPSNTWNCSHDNGNITCNYIPGNYPSGLETRFKVVLTYNN